MTDFLKYIIINPDIRFGKPCIKGTRIAVVDILNWMASGMSEKEIIEDHPKLTEQDIRAALMFSAKRDSITKITAA